MQFVHTRNHTSVFCINEHAIFQLVIRIGKLNHHPSLNEITSNAISSLSHISQRRHTDLLFYILDIAVYQSVSSMEIFCMCVFQKSQAIGLDKHIQCSRQINMKLTDLQTRLMSELNYKNSNFEFLSFRHGFFPAEIF